LQSFNDLNQQELDTFENNIQELKNISAFSTFKMINGYTVVEAIGKGAYGAVYEVHKGENRYAMKEIPLETIEGSEDEVHREV